MDKNNNGLDDKTESILLYIIAFTAVITAICGFFIKGMSTSTVTWLFGFASGLVGGKHAINNLFKRGDK